MYIDVSICVIILVCNMSGCIGEALDRNDQNIANYASWNKAMQKVGRKYIAIMDADFIARQDRLEKQFNYLEIHLDLLEIDSNCIFIPRDNRKGTTESTGIFENMFHDSRRIATLYSNLGMASPI